MSRQRLPRGRRALVSIVVGVIVLAAAVLATIVAIQLYMHRGGATAVGDIRTYATNLHDVRWSDVGILVAGIVLAAVGALVLLAGLLPARKTFLKLADPDDNTLAGITRGGLRSDMVATALAVAGIVDAKAKVRRKRIRIKAESPFTDRDGLADAVRSAAQRRVDNLQPLQRLTVKVRLRRKVSRKET